MRWPKIKSGKLIIDLQDKVFGTVREVAARIPNSCMKADPHIESRVKTPKKQYHVISKMLQASRFGWDDTEKCVT